MSRAISVTRGQATRTVSSLIGPITLAATAEGLKLVQLGKMKRCPSDDDGNEPRALRHLDATANALEEYFECRRKTFDDLVLAPAGTPFQLLVWEALGTIPYGETTTYGKIARTIRRPGSARAVGMANSHNPIAIVVPCHRVIGADGRLVGYSAGLDAKARLLRHEGVDI